MSNPLVSVVIPTLSRPEMFHQALASATAQTYDNVELIVSDDSPDSATESLIATLRGSLRSTKLTYRHNVPALGAARNFADSVALAAGKYINLLMDDDRLAPTMVERMVAVMEKNPAIALVTSCRARIDECGNRLGVLPGLEMVVPCDATLDGIDVGNICLVRSTNLIGEPSTALLRADAMVEPFGYMADRLYGCNVDMATWLRLASSGSVGFIREVLSETRRHSSQQSNTVEMLFLGVTDWLHQVRVGPTFGFLADTEVDKAAVNLAMSNAENVMRQGATLATSASEVEMRIAHLQSSLLCEMELLLDSRRSTPSLGASRRNANPSIT